ncbi:MAG: hypothetical protein PHW96_03175 [Candidatus Nanoarchaeia archaeon]|nr:hypothetical protein [Candidatus Nanoarchaeia archaeon]
MEISKEDVCNIKEDFEKELEETKQDNIELNRILSSDVTNSYVDELAFYIVSDAYSRKRF